MIYWDKLKDKLWDISPRWLCILYTNLRPTVLKCRLKRLYQRLTRGWDDSDTWSLDYTLYQWLLPRLKRFYELNNGYPNNKTAEEWDKELKHNISLLETLCEDNYEEHYSERQEFNKWLGENINNLWW